jgi:hypothetical protein
MNARKSENPQMFKDLAASYLEIPDGVLKPINGEVICLQGYLSPPSSQSRLRIHRDFANLSNFVEVPIAKVYAVFDALDI